MHANLSAVPPAATLKVTTSIVSVDADMANRWLTQNNTHNRVISPTRWREYASDMRAGRWHFNGESIQFDRKGILLNGQHRLLAIRDCGIPQVILVVRGLDPDVQVTIDQGTKRSPSEQLNIADIPSNNTVASAARVYLRWQTGRLFGDQIRNRITTSEVVEWAQVNPDSIRTLHDLSTAGLRRVFMRPSNTIAVGLRLHEIDAYEADEFLAALATGANLAADSPILALRSRLLSVKETGVKFTEKDAIGFFVIAWNAHRSGKSLSKMQRPRGGVWTAENFPVPK